MTRLVLLVPTFPKLSETFIVHKFLGLRARGWDVHVVCGRSPAEEWAHFPELARQPDVRRRVHVTWPHRPRWLAALLWPAALLRCALRQPRGCRRYLAHGRRRLGGRILARLYLDAELIILQPEIVHVAFGALAPERMELKALLGCRLSVSFRGYDLNRVGLEQPDFYREVWAQADGLHLLGEGLWRRAQERGCPPDTPHALIPPAIDTAVFSPPPGTAAESPAEARPLRILSVGRLTWEKGYEYALQAVRLLLDQGVACEYRIVGAGAYLEALAFARHELGLAAHVHFLGARAPAEVRAQMGWADVLLHTAVAEGFGNVVLEAQAMQLAVVCSDAGGLPENVVDGETGFVVPRRDARAAAARLAQLAGDPARRRRLGQAGRARVQAHFRLEDQTAALARFFEDVLNCKASHSLD
jgi:colanic acid/amylovoran biosynthesis glycosyltransferase